MAHLSQLPPESAARPGPQKWRWCSNRRSWMWPCREQTRCALSKQRRGDCSIPGCPVPAHPSVLSLAPCRGVGGGRRRRKEGRRAGASTPGAEPCHELLPGSRAWSTRGRAGAASPARDGEIWEEMPVHAQKKNLCFLPEALFLCFSWYYLKYLH